MSFEALCRAVESGNTSKAEDITRKLLEEGKEPLPASAWASDEAMRAPGFEEQDAPPQAFEETV